MADISWTDGDDDEHWFDPNNPWTPLPGVRTGGELSRGEKAADSVRNRMGSWGFVITFLGFMGVWAVINSLWLRNHGFDPYPYILLNLFLSMLAGLQGAILLIAAKRADAIAAEQALSHLTISKNSSEIIREVRHEMHELRKLAHDIHRLVDKEKEKNNE
jgi:uncharacterized membrane protein